jgi:CO/xanthine dehydrogenase Mo-binding subunit
MANTVGVGIDLPRKEAWDKVTGAAKYNADTIGPEILKVKVLTSPKAHAVIESIDTSAAEKVKGVLRVITGEYCPVLSGSLIEDRPPLARGKVRYFGEPVAAVVACTEQAAMAGVGAIRVVYKDLAVVNSIGEAVGPDALLVHPDLGNYITPTGAATPQPGTNIVDHFKIRKGNLERGWAESEVVIEGKFTLPQSDHLAMETRNARAQIMPDGDVIVHTSSQAPFAVKEELSKLYELPEGKVVVRTPLVGGAFGGKATTDLEFIAYLASKSVGGRKVKLVNSREEDIASSPCKIGVEAQLRLGATRDGLIRALECVYHVDCGAYAGTGPQMGKAIGVDCSGPYNIENLSCDVYSVYTNHTYVTSFRGFGHTAATFAVERMLDKLSASIGMNPLELRLRNAIRPGNFSPTMDKRTASNTGDITKCLLQLKETMGWEGSPRQTTEAGLIRAKGLGCFWKSSTSPTDAVSGALLTMNSDGTINVNVSAVEIGPGMKTTMAQILAEKLQMDVNRIYVAFEVDTRVSPKHWKTVASMSTFMVGNAVLDAARDLVRQLKSLGAVALKCSPEDLEIREEKVLLKADPETYMPFNELAHGYKYPEGSSLYGQIIGRGTYILKHLTELAKETGRGKVGAGWTVGAQGVEIEYDPKRYTYRLLKAATVMDVGRVLNPKTARGVIMGGMSMGLGLATREEFHYSPNGILQDTSLRTYKLLRYGENPEYAVGFVETPQIDGPLGARGLAEHGVLGIPAAVANALSLAAQCELDRIPVTPQLIWETKTGGRG